jgi:hypothetical protein
MRRIGADQIRDNPSDPRSSASYSETLKTKVPSNFLFRVCLAV